VNNKPQGWRRSGGCTCGQRQAPGRCSGSFPARGKPLTLQYPSLQNLHTTVRKLLGRPCCPGRRSSCSPCAKLHLRSGQPRGRAGVGIR
jgi:hypothetical protein